MSSVLHVSDLHFGSERSDVVLALLELHHRLAPELVVASGDFTQRARHHEFARARDFFERLAARATLFVPGNHDIPLLSPWERLLNPYGRYRSYLHGQLNPEFESADWLVLGVNSTAPERLEDGVIRAERAAEVERRLLAARPEQLRVVVTHQPLAALGPRDRRRVIGGVDATLQRWSRAGLDLALGGHSHVPYVVPLLGSAATYVVQAGTAISRRYRDRAPNSVNLLRAERGPTGRRCIVERYDHGPAGFELHGATPLELRS